MNTSSHLMSVVLLFLFTTKFEVFLVKALPVSFKDQLDCDIRLYDDTWSLQWISRLCDNEIDLDIKSNQNAIGQEKFGNRIKYESRPMSRVLCKTHYANRKV